MGKYRNRLPQLADRLLLTDGGLETTLIFHENLALPYFAAFDLLKNKVGTEILRRHFTTHARLATASSVGTVLDGPTWRANLDWGGKLRASWEWDMAGHK
jgi:S-methylmethionine-dependent homocysteine/selenocysteine methylase